MLCIVRRRVQNAWHVRFARVLREVDN
jgi:hypothetical protein